MHKLKVRRANQRRAVRRGHCKCPVVLRFQRLCCVAVRRRGERDLHRVVPSDEVQQQQRVAVGLKVLVHDAVDRVVVLVPQTGGDL